MLLKTVVSLTAITAVSLGISTAVAPAQAATKSTISVHIQSPSKKPLKDIEVTAGNGKTWVYLGRSDSKGNVSRAGGKYEGKLSAGTWKFNLHDLNVKRHQQGKEFAPRNFSAKVSKGKNTSLGNKALAVGAHASGTVTAPSGRPVKYVDVAVTPRPNNNSGFLDFSTTVAKGKYQVDGLAVGTVYFSASASSQITPYRKVVIKKAGARTTGINFTNVLVQCQGRLTAKAGDPGTVTLTANTDTSFYGLTNPHGTVKLYRGTTLLDTVSFTNMHSITKTYTNQVPGKSTYTVKYTDGDCEPWSESASATVKETPLPE